MVSWIMTGPLFDGDGRSQLIGETRRNETPAAVPDKLFEVVIRIDGGVQVLPFVSDNATERQGAKPDHVSALRSVRAVP